MARLIEILNQLVRQVALERQHVPPNRLRDLNSLRRGLSRKPGFPNRVDGHRSLLGTYRSNYNKTVAIHQDSRRTCIPALTFQGWRGGATRSSKLSEAAEWERSAL